MEPMYRRNCWIPTLWLLGVSLCTVVGFSLETASPAGLDWEGLVRKPGSDWIVKKPSSDFSLSLLAPVQDFIALG